MNTDPKNQKWMSRAWWPPQCCPSIGNYSQDFHYSKESAEAVCSLLHKNGFGGDHIFFPTRTEVIEVGEANDTKPSASGQPAQGTTPLPCPLCQAHLLKARIGPGYHHPGNGCLLSFLPVATLEYWNARPDNTELRGELAEKVAEVEKLTRERDKLQIERGSSAFARAERLATELRKLEWVNRDVHTSTTERRCPNCGVTKPNHANDCTLAAALEETK